MLYSIGFAQYNNFMGRPNNEVQLYGEHSIDGIKKVIVPKSYNGTASSTVSGSGNNGTCYTAALKITAVYQILLSPAWVEVDTKTWTARYCTPEGMRPRTGGGSFNPRNDIPPPSTGGAGGSAGLPGSGGGGGGGGSVGAVGTCFVNGGWVPCN